MTLLQYQHHSCDSVMHKIFSYLEDVEDLSSCQCVCSRWRKILHAHPSWTCFCLRQWNLPKSFSGLYQVHDAKSCCQQWHKRANKIKDSLFLNHFVACFKTFCGGGEQEAYILHDKLASDELIHHLRNKQFVMSLQQQQDDYVNTSSSDDDDEEENVAMNCAHMNELRANQWDHSLVSSLPYTPFDNALNLHKLNEHAKEPQRSIFCQVDISNVATVNDNAGSIREGENLNDLSDLWLYSLHNQLRLVDHRRYVQPDATAIVAYICLFFDMLEKALLQLQDDEVFLHMLYNTLKKVNVFLRLLDNKSDFMMDISHKEKWDDLVQQLNKVWLALPAKHPKLFTRTLKIASTLAREYFANHKPEALVRCFDIFFLLNPDALGGCPNAPTPNKPATIFGEPILNAYMAMVNQILKENVHLSSFKSIAAQFDHFHHMFTSLTQDDDMFKQYVLQSDVVSTNFVHKYQLKMLEQFLHLHGYLCKSIRNSYEKYDAATMFPTEKQHQPMHHYLNIPQELEISFDGISLCRPGESQKFDKFMHTYHDILQELIASIESYAMPWSKKPSVQRVVNELKRKRETLQTEQASKRKRT